MSVIVARRIIMLGGFPDYTFSGAHTIVDTGVDSGSWQIALTSTGTLTLNKKIRKAGIKIQAGGGGGGASDGSTNGSDGMDGGIATLTDQALEAGSYEIIIGAGGARGYDSEGYAGGDTSFGDLLNAQGGAGGEYAGAITLEHNSVYSNYGQGGPGGTIDQHDGELTTLYYTKIRTTGYAYLRNGPNKYSGSPGVVYNGEIFYVEGDDEGAIKYPDTDTSESTTWYKLTDGRGYIDTSSCMPLTTETSDTRAWYGVAGNPGVVLISGKA